MNSTFSASRKASMAFVLATLPIDVLSFGMIFPVFPQLLMQFSVDTAQAAMLFGLFGAVWAAMQFLSAPVLGALSDRYGRRPVILLSCLGLGLDFVLMAVATRLPWLLIGSVISGITSATGPTRSSGSRSSRPNVRARSVYISGENALSSPPG